MIITDFEDEEANEDNHMKYEVNTLGQEEDSFVIQL